MSKLSTLSALEEIIERNLRSYWEVGGALREIRDGKLYEPEYPDFEAYLDQRWEYTRQHAYRFIDARSVAEVVSPAGDTLPAERHVRELAPLAKKNPEAAVLAWNALVAEHRAGMTSEHVRAAVQSVLPQKPARHPQPEPHPPTDGDRSTDPAPEVPPAPSSPSPDEEVIANADGQPRREPDEPPHDTPPAAEPSEPGVAGDLWGLPVHEDGNLPPRTVVIGDGPICTDPAHADLLGLIRDLDRLLLPRDEEDWRAWDLGDDEPAGRALMARVRSLLGQQASDLSVDRVAPDVDGSDLSEEPPGADLISGSGVDAGAEITEREEPPDPRIAAIGRTVARMPAKDRARFLRAHRITDLELWLDGLDGDELDSALRLLGLVGAETA